MPHDDVLADAEQMAEYREQLNAWETKTADLRKRINDIEQPYKVNYRDIAIDRFPDDLKAIARKSVQARAPAEEQLAYLVYRQVLAEYERLDQYVSAKDKEALVELRRELKAFDAIKPTPLPIVIMNIDNPPIWFQPT